MTSPPHTHDCSSRTPHKSACVHESVARTCEPPSIGDRGITNPWPQSQPLRIFDMICHGRRRFSPSEEGVRSPCRGECTTPETCRDVPNGQRSYTAVTQRRKGENREHAVFRKRPVGC